MTSGFFSALKQLSAWQPDGRGKDDVVEGGGVMVGTLEETIDAVEDVTRHEHAELTADGDLLQFPR